MYEPLKVVTAVASMRQKIMKKKQSTCHCKLFPLFKTIIREPGSLRMGIAGDAGSRGFVVAHRGKELGNGAIPLAWGDGIPLWMRLLLPVVAHADIGMVPVYLTNADTGGEDPDAWIDRNEARLIPKGFSTEQIVTNYDVEGRNLTALSAVETARDALYAELEENVTVASLQPPLQGLAALYGNVSTMPWILWKITDTGSVMGRIEAGKVTDVCHSWIDIEAAMKDGAAMLGEAEPLLKSLSGTGTTLRVMIWTADDALQLFTGENNLRKGLLSPPPVAGLHRRYHEAFGNALAIRETAQLVPFEKRLNAEAVLRKWHATVAFMRIAAFALAVIAAVAVVSISINRLLINHDRETMLAIDTQYSTLQTLSAQRDSLADRIRKLVTFSAGESTITRFLGALQTVIPEGMKIEELTITERDVATWRVTLRAFALSGSIVQSMIACLREVEGIDNVYMVYSEQASGKGTGKGIRVKVEADWK